MKIYNYHNGEKAIFIGYEKVVLSENQAIALELFFRNLDEAANMLGIGNNSKYVENSYEVKLQAAQMSTIEAFERRSPSGQVVKATFLVVNGKAIAGFSPENPNVALKVEAAYNAFKN